MSLPTKAIDRLFERLAATYGAQWVRQWADVPIADVKTVWAYELSGFSGRLEALAWALDNLPPKCPNAIEFRSICRAAPMPPAMVLPEPPADPERLRAELSKLGQLRAATVAATSEHDGKAWARRHIAAHAAGIQVRPITLRFAREALRAHLMPEAA